MKNMLGSQPQSGLIVRSVHYSFSIADLLALGDCNSYDGHRGGVSRIANIGIRDVRHLDSWNLFCRLLRVLRDNSELKLLASGLFIPACAAWATAVARKPQVGGAVRRSACHDGHHY
jgi:hypothetical protein